MGLNALFFLLVFVVGFSLSLLRHPSWGMLTYIFVYCNMPVMQWWGGQVPDIRWSFVSFWLVVISSILQFNKLVELRALYNKPNLFLILMLVGMWCLLPFSYDYGISLERCFVFLKIVSIYLLVQLTVTTPRQYLYVIVVLIFGMLTIAYQAFFSFSGVRLDGIGLIDANDANLLAGAMCIMLPFAISFVISGKRLWRFLGCCAVPLMFNVIAMTRSRGALLGLSAGGIYFLMSQKGFKQKILGFLVLGGSAVVFVSLMDAQYLDRFLFALTGGGDDVSLVSRSAGRSGIWSFIPDIVAQHPLGLGGGGFMQASAEVLPPALLNDNGVRVVHNTYLQLVVENSILVFLLYLCFTVSLFVMIHRTIKQNRQFFSGDGARSMIDRMCFMHLTSFKVALLINSVVIFFLDRVYFELFYLVAACGIVLCRVGRFHL